MGKFCQVCGKGLMTGHNVSHSNRKSNRTWAPNVQKVRIDLGSSTVSVNVCTRCLRSGYVQRAVHQVRVPAETAAPAEAPAVPQEG